MASSFSWYLIFPLLVQSLEVAAHACALVLVHILLLTKGHNFMPTQWICPGINMLNVHTRNFCESYADVVKG